MEAVLEIDPGMDWDLEIQWIVAEIDVITPDVIIYRTRSGIVPGDKQIIARQYVSAIFPALYMVGRKVRYSARMADYVWEILTNAQGFPRQFTTVRKAQVHADSRNVEGGTWKAVIAVPSSDLAHTKVVLEL